MSRTIGFPERERSLHDIANECAWRVLQLEASPVREVARENARKSPIQLYFPSVAEATVGAVEGLRLDSRVLDAIRAEIGEEDFRRVSDRLLGVIDDALTAASNRIAREAMAERVRELSEQESVPLADDPGLGWE